MDEAIEVCPSAVALQESSLTKRTCVCGRQLMQLAKRRMRMRRRPARAGFLRAWIDRTACRSLLSRFSPLSSSHAHARVLNHLPSFSPY